MHNELQNNSIMLNDTESQKLYRYAMVMEYNGSGYAGSQKQLEQKTVQSELESVLSILTKSDIKTIFSGRTDSGVHARGQVVHFNLPYQIDTYRFLHSLNSILPPDISISVMKEVDGEFHSLKSAMHRWYRYTINNRPQRSALLKEAIHLCNPLDIQEMNKALSYLIGEHDFSSFKSANTNPATVCNMYYAKCESEAGIIHIDFIANRFLYNMVRIIVGTLISIGKGVYPAEYMLEILNAQDRTKAGPTARPEGLTLMSVNYGKKYDLSNYLNMEAIHNENLLCKAS